MASDKSHKDTYDYPEVTEQIQTPQKYPLSKFEYDLYKEEDNVKEKVIRIKAIYSIKKGDKWRIFEDNKLIFTLDGSKLTKKDRAFLKTPEGMNWLLTKAKNGIKSFNFIKNEIKKKLAAT